MKAKNLRISAFLLCVFLNPASGLPKAVSFGLSAGVPINHLMMADNDQVASTGRFTFGPALRLQLPHGFGFCSELLYKRLDFGSVSDSARAGVHRLEVPLLLEYVFSGLPAHPLVHAGMSFNRVIEVNGASVCGRGEFGDELLCIADNEITELRHRHTHGPVLGIGFDFGLGTVHLVPELRFTRWVDRNFGTRDSPVRSSLNQVELLFELKF